MISCFLLVFKKSFTHLYSLFVVLFLHFFSAGRGQILDCATMWPQLQDLCVEDNNITELQRYRRHFCFLFPSS